MMPKGANNLQGDGDALKFAGLNEPAEAPEVLHHVMSMYTLLPGAGRAAGEIVHILQDSNTFAAPVADCFVISVEIYCVS